MGSVRVIAAALVLGALAGCGGSHRSSFCGLVRSPDGFEPVAAVRGASCAQAMRLIASGERDWTCSRAMHASYELDCRSGEREVRILENVPARAKRHGDEVTLANWSFRIAGRDLQARQRGAWADVTGPPYCVTDVPGAVLVALGLRPHAPPDGCFTRPGR